MSGYAPARNGQGRYLVGMDMRANEVQRKMQHLRISGLISLVASIILAVIFSHLLSGSFVRRIKSLVDNCRALATGTPIEIIRPRAGDELDGLVKEFNSMALQLDESRAETRKANEALQKANKELELRVQERTAQLTGLNSRLLEEISEKKRTEKEKESLIEELTRTLSQVKTLSGLLPICCACKKIRDDKGYWNQIEGYIRDHSGAEFTHSICPECKSRLYPDLC
jgi:methyl-accepting chemotaxis protein